MGKKFCLFRVLAETRKGPRQSTQQVVDIREQSARFADLVSVLYFRERSPMPKAKMDAIALLKADHRKVEDLFEKYEKSRGKKAEIAKKICLELIVHSMLEEEIFYPACREAGVEADIMDEAAVEHDGAKVLIAELENGSPDDDYYDAKVKVLSEEIKHHVKEEEKRGGIFTQAKSNGVDLEALGEQIMTRKEELLAEIDEENLPTPVTVTMTGPALERGQAQQ
jgi:hemerythrin superfamily protein